MSEKLKYSIILPIYNVEEYLHRCIESILKQTSPSNFEIIAVDDGSTDNSGAICDEFANAHSNIKVIHQQNKWISAARNAGIKAAQGEYILFLDPDDYWDAELLATLDKLLESQPDMALFSFSRVDEENNIAPHTIQILPASESGEEYLLKLLKENELPLPFVWAFVYRRDFLVSNQLYFKEDIRAAEDFDFIMRTLPAAKSIIGTNDALHYYLIREGSHTASMSPKKILDNLVCKNEIFRRYPTTSIANNYVWFVVATRNSITYKNKDILNVLKQNKDILNLVTHPTLKLAVKFFRLFGFVCGLRVFWLLSDIKGFIKKA